MQPLNKVQSPDTKGQLGMSRKVKIMRDILLLKSSNTKGQVPQAYVIAV